MLKISLILKSLVAIIFVFFVLSCDAAVDSNNPGEDPNVLRVTYNGNQNVSGNAPSSTTHELNDTVQVESNLGNLLKIPADGTAEAYKFGGWNTRSDGNGDNYEEGLGTFTITKSLTLYAEWVPYVIEDIGPATGIVFYDKGLFSDGWRYLSVSPVDLIACSWGAYNIFLQTSPSIGTGMANTITIIGKDASTNIAAYRCNNYEITNNNILYNDWFLPSSEEAYELRSLADYSNIVNDDDYWTSTYDSMGQAYYYDVIYSENDHATKTYEKEVRAIRAF